MENDPDTVQRIAQETVQALRAMSKRVDMTTGKVERAVSDAIRKSGLVEDVKRHDQFIVDFAKAWKSINGITAFLEKVSGYKG